MQDLKVSLVQTSQYWENKKKNLQHFEELIKKEVKTPNLVVLPEMFHTGFSMRATDLAETMEGIGVQWLQNQARKWDAAFATSLIIKENDLFYNRFVFVEPKGEIQFYNKRKLFTYAKEEQTYTPGHEKVIVNYKEWKILLQVCYDLRFPNVQRNAVKNGGFDYDIMINVANWPEKRALHWKTLLQARAIENQAFVIGVNRVGEGNGLNYSGDSALVSPSGEIIVQKSFEEQVINVVLSYENLEKIRKNLPFLKDS